MQGHALVQQAAFRAASVDGRTQVIPAARAAEFPPGRGPLAGGYSVRVESGKDNVFLPRAVTPEVRPGLEPVACDLTVVRGVALRAAAVPPGAGSWPPPPPSSALPSG